MFQLFDYQKIDVHLSRATKTLILTLKENEDFSINLETLIELESVLNWAYPKVEICSILLRGQNDIFSRGLAKQSLKAIDSARILKLRDSLFRIQTLFLKAPQLIVMDLGESCDNLAFELSFAADIRVGSLNGRYRFNNLELGLPMLSTSTLPKQKFSLSFLESALYSNSALNAEQLNEIGFLQGCYDSSTKEAVIAHLLTEIAQQAPLPRIQSKVILTQELCFELETRFQDETTSVHAALSAEDWNKSVFTNARKVKQKVKMTLIPGGKED